MFTTLSKDPLDITRREFDHLFDIPTEEFSADEDYNKKVHDELFGIFRRVLDVYISDYPTGNICDKYVVSHVVKAIVNSGLEELSDQLKTAYSKDMVDKKICGELDTNLSVMKDLGCADLNYIETGIYPLMFLPTYLIWDNADNPDFGEQ